MQFNNFYGTLLLIRLFRLTVTVRRTDDDGVTVRLSFRVAGQLAHFDLDSNGQHFSHDRQIKN